MDNVNSVRSADNVNSMDNVNSANSAPFIPAAPPRRRITAVGTVDIVHADIVRAAHAVDIVHAVHTLDVAIT